MQPLMRKYYQHELTKKKRKLYWLNQRPGFDEGFAGYDQDVQKENGGDDECPEN